MKRAILGVCAIACVGAVTVLLVTLVNLTVYSEASVPSKDELPELPAGLSMANETAGCGSGICYREFDVVGDLGDTSDSVIARLPSREECAAHSLLDWRPLCVGYRLQGDSVKGYVSLGKWMGG